MGRESAYVEPCDVEVLFELAKVGAKLKTERVKRVGMER